MLFKAHYAPVILVAMIALSQALPIESTKARSLGEVAYEVDVRSFGDAGEYAVAGRAFDEWADYILEGRTGESNKKSGSPGFNITPHPPTSSNPKPPSPKPPANAAPAHQNLPPPLSKNDLHKKSKPLNRRSLGGDDPAFDLDSRSLLDEYDNEVLEGRSGDKKSSSPTFDISPHPPTSNAPKPPSPKPAANAAHQNLPPPLSKSDLHSKSKPLNRRAFTDDDDDFDLGMKRRSLQAELLSLRNFEGDF